MSQAPARRRQGRGASPRVRARRAADCAIGTFLDAVQGEPEGARGALLRCMSPLTLTPKIEEPGKRFRVTGSVDLTPLAAGGASGSSGGRI